MAENIFAVQIFFIVFRECLEATIILSALLSFLQQYLSGPGRDNPALRRRLQRQVWLGAAAGLVLCLVIGGALIGVFYGIGRDIWSESEELWEGIFYLIACLIITVVGLALLRVNKMQEKWRAKLGHAITQQAQQQQQQQPGTEATTTTTTAAAAEPVPLGSTLGSWSSRHVMFILPFVTTLREGVEAVVFVGGVSLSLPASAFPLPVVCGLAAAVAVGWLLYRGGSALSVQLFLVACTSLLYLMAAGMFSKAVWLLQYHTFAARIGSDVAETGSGPGSYDIRQAVWHVNCCNPETDNGWIVFNALLGWQNTGTYGSIISYNVYWIFIMAAIGCMMYEERTGAFPLQRPALRVLARVPVLRGWAEKKMAMRGEGAETEPGVVAGGAWEGGQAAAANGNGAANGNANDNTIVVHHGSSEDLVSEATATGPHAGGIDDKNVHPVDHRSDHAESGK